ncbi:hypothetical protein ACFRMQ_01865 [Kitasatospora sp. NPDC056783]|uniref:hypothetical protein n=1 Tax=Kitasatospora sp. NPDC056783 TaxID=3345943 RepID=UPI003680BF12
MRTRDIPSIALPRQSLRDAPTHAERDSETVVDAEPARGESIVNAWGKTVRYELDRPA